MAKIQRLIELTRRDDRGQALVDVLVVEMDRRGERGALMYRGWV
jgi:hypothetical protein